MTYHAGCLIRRACLISARARYRRPAICLAVAIFSRLAGPEEYGHYILIFAWSLIVYGFGTQWMRFAYFGVYQTERFGEYVGSLRGFLLGGLTVVAVVLAALGASGWFAPSFLIAVFALVCGTALYEAAFEVARTLLNVRIADAVDDLARAAHGRVRKRELVVRRRGARSRHRGRAGANLRRHSVAGELFAASAGRARTRAAALRILSYGWPLLLSFGVTAVAQSIDRLLLAHYLGAATLGPYGVVADVLRQSFTVVGEAITLSLVTIAKRPRE